MFLIAQFVYFCLPFLFTFVYLLHITYFWKTYFLVHFLPIHFFLIWLWVFHSNPFYANHVCVLSSSSALFDKVFRQLCALLPLEVERIWWLCIQLYLINVDLKYCVSLLMSLMKFIKSVWQLWQYLYWKIVTKRAKITKSSDATKFRPKFGFQTCFGRNRN